MNNNLKIHSLAALPKIVDILNLIRRVSKCVETSDVSEVACFLSY